MTFSILSLASGSILESYTTEERVYQAAARICNAEPETTDSLAVISFDDDGAVIEAVDGEELYERLHAFKPANATPA